MFFRDNFEMRADPLLYMLMMLHLCARITASVRTIIFNEFLSMLKIHYLSFD
jgi:hypothetical protein